ncbi:MAG TPA: TolC family protein [Thermoanaerobaculia bacterium]|nr:TolC family protein [Thermoanaerobaculia bacterium]
MTRLLAIVLSFSILAPPALAEAALDLDTLLALARERAPALATRRARAAAARERVAPAGALANPMIEGRWANAGATELTLGEEDMSVLELMVKQELPGRGKRQARRDAARAAVAVEEAALVALERGLEREVRRLWARLYALDREVAALDAGHELLELLAATVTARYGAGGGEQEAVLKVQLRLALHDEMRVGVVGEREETAAELRRLLDLDQATSLGPVEVLPTFEPLPPDLAEKAVAGSAEVALRRAEVAAAEGELAVEKLDLEPDFAAVSAFGYRAEMEPMLTVGLAVELPFWRRQRQEPLIRAAGQEVEAARAALREAEVALRGEAQVLFARWRRIEGQARLVREAVLPQASATLDAGRAAFLADRGEFGTVIEDFDLWLEARVRSAALEAERFITWAEAQALLPAASTSEGGQS